MKQNLNINNSNEEFDTWFNDNTSSDIETTCLSCGYTKLVPDFIYDEMSRKKYHFKIKKRVSTLTCQKCGKNTAVPSSFLKNN